MLRSIEYTLSPNGITPHSLQFAGIQGEHEATQVSFVPDEDFADVLAGLLETYDELTWHYECLDGMGRRLVGEVREFDGEMQVPLTRQMTEAGGRMTLTAVISGVNQDEDLAVCLFTFPVSLYFRDFPVCTDLSRGGDLNKAVCQVQKMRGEVYDIALAANETDSRIGALSDHVDQQAAQIGTKCSEFEDLSETALAQMAETLEEIEETAQDTVTEIETFAAEKAAEFTAAVEAAQAAQTAAVGAKDAAVSAKNDAVTAKTDAVTAKTAAETASTAAIAAKDAAVSAKNDAVTAKTDAVTAKTAAETASTAAVAAKDAAVSAKNDAVTAKEDAVAAKTAATTAKSEALTAKNGAVNAKTAATNAKNAAEAARDRAEAAATSVAVDQTYNAQSTKAQSGIAVAQALTGKQDKLFDTLYEGGIFPRFDQLIIFPKNDRDNPYVVFQTSGMNETMMFPRGAISLHTPTADNELVTKSYVDNLIQQVYNTFI